MRVLANGDIPAPRLEGRPVAACLTLCLVLCTALLFQQDSVSGNVGAFLTAMLALGTGIAVVEWPTEGLKSEEMAPLIAIVGCDGSGKSTLSADLARWLGKARRTQNCYLGLGSGAMGDKIRAWPVIGRAVEAKLAAKAKQTRTRGETIPGVLTALVVFALSLARYRRFRKMLALRRGGVTIITDRYPQTDVAGFYDGPGLSAALAGGRFIAWLAARERQLYEWMESFTPDVVIRLNIDVETAQLRRPDHPRESLVAKVAATPRITFKGARIVDVDSRRPYDEVRANAWETVSRAGAAV